MLWCRIPIKVRYKANFRLFFTLLVQVYQIEVHSANIMVVVFVRGCGGAVLGGMSSISAACRD